MRQAPVSGVVQNLELYHNYALQKSLNTGLSTFRFIGLFTMGVSVTLQVLPKR